MYLNYWSILAYRTASGEKTPGEALIFALSVLALFGVGYFIIEFLNKKTICDNCKEEITRFSTLGSIYSNDGNFCCRRCQQEYRSREADIQHKEKIAGKGTQHTRTNRWL